MRKKILFCATVDYHFKAFHLPYLKWFKEQGWDVHIAASGEMELPYVDKKYSIPVQRSPFHFKNIRAYKELKKIIDENNYDIVHCHTPMGGVLARLASKSARKKGSRILYTAHGFHFCKGAPLANWMIYYPIEKFLSHYTDCLITINQEDYQLAKQRFKTSTINHVHGIGVNTERFKPIQDSEKKFLRQSFGFKRDDFLLFYAAEFNKNKNQQLLIRSLALIKHEVSNLKLLLAGEGPLLESCRELANNLDVGHMIEFLGYRNDIEEIVPLCDVAVGSSYREGLPVNIMEAMACGLPIVASVNRGHSELVKDGVNGFLIEPSQYESFSTKLLDLYQTKDLCGKMGSESVKRVKAYSLNEVSKEMIHLYSRYMVDNGQEIKSQVYM